MSDSLFDEQNVAAFREVEDSLTEEQWKDLNGVLDAAKPILMTVLPHFVNVLTEPQKNLMADVGLRMMFGSRPNS